MELGPSFPPDITSHNITLHLTSYPQVQLCNETPTRSWGPSHNYNRIICITIEGKNLGNYTVRDKIRDLNVIEYLEVSFGYYIRDGNNGEVSSPLTLSLFIERISPYRSFTILTLNLCLVKLRLVLRGGFG